MACFVTLALSARVFAAHSKIARPLQMLDELGKHEINEITVEAGHTLSGAMLQAGLVDELMIYQAPLLLGDKARGMFDLPELK